MVLSFHVFCCSGLGGLFCRNWFAIGVVFVRYSFCYGALWGNEMVI